MTCLRCDTCDFRDGDAIACPVASDSTRVASFEKDATWEEVKQKGRLIFQNGGVTLESQESSGKGTWFAKVDSNVVKDMIGNPLPTIGDVYDVIVAAGGWEGTSVEPKNTGGWVKWCACSCPWGQYRMDSDSIWKDRLCSHVYATILAINKENRLPKKFIGDRSAMVYDEKTAAVHDMPSFADFDKGSFDNYSWTDGEIDVVLYDEGYGWGWQVAKHGGILGSFALADSGEVFDSAGDAYWDFADMAQSGFVFGTVRFEPQPAHAYASIEKKGEVLDILDFDGMSKDEIYDKLDSMEVGSSITGLIDSYWGTESRVEKHEEFSPNYFAPQWAGGSPNDYGSMKTIWKVNGSDKPYLGTTIYNVLHDGDKYYYIASIQKEANMKVSVYEIPDGALQGAWDHFTRDLGWDPYEISLYDMANELVQFWGVQEPHSYEDYDALLGAIRNFINYDLGYDVSGNDSVDFDIGFNEFHVGTKGNKIKRADMSPYGVEYFAVDYIDPSWEGYDKIVAEAMLDTYGEIYVDEYGLPIDNEYDQEEIFNSRNAALANRHVGKMASREFTYAEQQELQDEAIGTLCRNHSKLKGADGGRVAESMFM